jgi:RNA polymerase sigma-70 factor (ECF subfamily)
MLAKADTRGPEERSEADSDFAALLREAVRGDGAAFERVVEAHETRLYRQALALCGDPIEAEDLAAETIIEVWKSLGRYRGGCRFSTWLYGILLHRHQKSVRRQLSRPPLAAKSSLSDLGGDADRVANTDSRHPDASEFVQQLEHHRTLQRAISQLPSAHQAVVLLRFFEDASLNEISEALSIPVGTVKSRLFHALERLRESPDVLNLWSGEGDIQV